MIGKFLSVFQRKFCLYVFVITLCVNISYALTWTEKNDNLFRQWNKPNSPGAGLLIVKDGKIVYEKGYGMANIEYHIPISENTVFDFGSNSKQFVAFSILLLEEEGKLSLDDDIHKFLPEMPDFGKLITIRHLIYHTSGLRDYLEMLMYAGWNGLSDIITTEHTEAMILRQKELNFEPGAQFLYSNTGYVMLAQIVSKISKQPFADFVKKRIFEPLGMNDTFFQDISFQIIPNKAISYQADTNKTYYLNPYYAYLTGAGGLNSTLRDIAKWDENFYNPKAGNSALFQKMLIRGVQNNGAQIPYSMALITDVYKGRNLVYHGGDIAGFHSQIFRFPDEHLTIILAVNTAELMSTDLTQKSVTISDYYFTGQTTGISDFPKYEIGSAGWGFGETPVSLFDSKLESFFFMHDRALQADKTASVMPAVKPQMSQATATEYLGTYYSEELDVYWTIEFDGKSVLLFKTARVLPYLFSVVSVVKNKFTAKEASGITGEFVRNDKNQITGFKLSGARALKMPFKKVEVIPLQ